MAKKRNLFKEIREGLMAYRDKHKALRQHKLSIPDKLKAGAEVVPIRKAK
jgi:hypothetical protein